MTEPSLFDEVKEVPHAGTVRESPATTQFASPALGFIVPARSVVGYMPSDNMEASKRTPNRFDQPPPNFDSWPDTMRFAWQAARDRHSATVAAAQGEDPNFYLRRAEIFDGR